MQPEITSARHANGMKISKLLRVLPEMLNPGETAFLIGYTDTWAPVADTFILTTQRLVVTVGKNVAKSNAWHVITGFTYVAEKRGAKVFLRADDPYNINRLKPEDRAALQAALEVFPTMGPGSASWNAWVQRRAELIAPGQPMPTAAQGFPPASTEASSAIPAPFRPLSPAPLPASSAPALTASSAQVQSFASPAAPVTGLSSPTAPATDNPTSAASAAGFPTSAASAAEVPASAAPAARMSLRDELLAQLENLLAHKVLTTDEYADATARLLAREQW